jgi:hypothetical protein
MTIASTMESCITTCSLTSGCVAVSYAPGSGGACYLKNALNTAVGNNGESFDLVKVPSLISIQVSGEQDSLQTPHQLAVHSPSLVHKPMGKLLRIAMAQLGR